jgi:hypothetical protein
MEIPLTLSHADPRGSVWRRWDPHLHTPGTVLNDQYAGEDAWEQYLSRLESSSPAIEVLGVTDYWSIDRYEDVVAHKAAGRLPNVGLIFPNVEIRFGIGTGSNSPINAHLLVSPEEPDHVERLRGVLASLTFQVDGETYRCTRQDLIKLGRAHDRIAIDEMAALQTGTNQFKVSLDDLKRAIAGSNWAKKHILIAVAAGTGDGSSGLQGDASLAALRREIERTAHVIFSGRPGDREFWVGKASRTVEEVAATYGGLKACLHGSDAHGIEKVGNPDLDRFTWIRGDTSFESLRQACIEPQARVFIGGSPPDRALAYRTITSLSLEGAPWCATPNIPLNSGLIGIIGARGSGKTALADLIATGGLSSEARANPRSFMSRAREHLGAMRIQLHWGDGTTTISALGANDVEGFDPARVQYLSQQFVDRLCSADGGVTDELLHEIERVIYEEHPLESRVGTSTFGELLSVKASRARRSRARSQEAIADTVKQINAERAKDVSLEVLQVRRDADTKVIVGDKAARTGLMVSGDEGRTARLRDFNAAVEARQLLLDACERTKQALLTLQDAVNDTRTRQLPVRLTRLTQQHAEAGLTVDDWALFDLQFVGDVDTVITERLIEADQRVVDLTGTPLSDVVEPNGDGSWVSPEADASAAPLEALRREVRRLQELIGLDAQKQAKLRALDAKIAKDEIALAKLSERITDARGAKSRIATLKVQRQTAYSAIFDAFIEEEKELTSLYAPLASTLEDEAGVLGKLTFLVRRVVDVGRWANEGEDLLDLRTSGPFRGRGALLDAASAELLDPWQRGSSSEIEAAMTRFREKHDETLMKHAPVDPAERTAYWVWGAKISTWLTSVDHIRLAYGVQYDGVDIEQLSPGTRGIVLLLLYLSVDRNDDRPLIIDQPEENLDPKSIFDELVERFRATRERRQVLIVTHNANLIVNTDADQVIVATAGSHCAGELPQMSYSSGGLENSDIRREVCEILEGGERAFRERARRLRLGLETTATR